MPYSRQRLNVTVTDQMLADAFKFYREAPTGSKQRKNLRRRYERLKALQVKQQNQPVDEQQRFIR